MFCLLLLAAVASAAPCDIYGAFGTPCVAAHSTTRSLYAGYRSHLYQVRRGSDQKTLDIGLSRGSFVADAGAQDSFCERTTCVITIIYDQSGHGNHLSQAGPGSAGGGPEPGGLDSLASAIGAPVSLGGKKAYGVFTWPGSGYRNDKTTGVATGDEPEGMYGVFDGTHYNHFCCYDYGNAEVDNVDSGNGEMEAIYFGIGGYQGSGDGPWVQADLENGLFSGHDPTINPQNPSVQARFVTAIVKGKPNYWEIRGGNAASGKISTFYNGTRPDGGYNPMHKEGAIILGIGGDNSVRGQGTFYEGAMTKGFPSDVAESLVQTDILLMARYGTVSLVSGPALSINSHISVQMSSGYVSHSGATVSVGAASDKEAATWVVRKGQVFSGDCYSFEALDAPGTFIRRSANETLVAQTTDGTQLYNEDITFCPESGIAGHGTSFRSWNHPDRYWRDINGAMYAGRNGGANATDVSAGFNDQVTFTVVKGLA